jgi:uncharacterized protein YbbC (DUF1343 family)
MPPCAARSKRRRKEGNMGAVITGLERWCSDREEVGDLRSRARIGLVAHPASVDRSARHAVELLSLLDGVRLVRLFAPEHGLHGQEQDMERVSETIDPVSGLPVISLYGADAASLRPRREDLSGLEAIVVDLQDIGSRYYTFVYTLSYVMEAAAEVGLPVVVLDRPNPIGGDRVEGPVLDPAMSSFVGRYPIAVRHGMTIGELAGLFNSGFAIGCDLRVVMMAGWRRSMGFEATGLPWVPPSPNMPSLSTARVYPGGCLIEGTNLSEGRGTTLPFELVGAPWLDAHRLADVMRGQGLLGVLFRPACFRPMFQKHAGKTCGGVQVIVADASSFRPFETYLTLLVQARLQAPEEFGWRVEPYEFETERLAIDLLLGRHDLRRQLESGASAASLERSWLPELEEFRRLRESFLLYD